jgi:hypothetical protein
MPASADMTEATRHLVSWRLGGSIFLVATLEDHHGTAY